MGIGTKLNQTLRTFIEYQPVFFVATAAPGGRVNVSPKGMSTLRILGDAHIRWLNLSGSGNETAAHLRASNRMTLMFCAFEGKPMILCVYGQSTTEYWRGEDRRFPHPRGVAADRPETRSCKPPAEAVCRMRFVKDRGAEEFVPIRADGPGGRRRVLATQERSHRRHGYGDLR